MVCVPQSKMSSFTLTITLPLAKLAALTKATPEWLIQHQADLSEYFSGYFVCEGEIENDNAVMLTQMADDVRAATEADDAVAEIAENWRSTEQEPEEEQEFYDELHDPETDAKSLLDGQFAVPRTLTEGQWVEVLSRVRELFPKPVV